MQELVNQLIPDASVEAVSRYKIFLTLPTVSHPEEFVKAYFLYPHKKDSVI